jgi:hypothetical protein
METFCSFDNRKRTAQLIKHKNTGQKVLGLILARTATDIPTDECRADEK